MKTMSQPQLEQMQNERSKLTEARDGRFVKLCDTLSGALCGDDDRPWQDVYSDVMLQVIELCATDRKFGRYDGAISMNIGAFPIPRVEDPSTAAQNMLEFPRPGVFDSGS